ncbi:MAG: hypothetical protein RR838_04610 [Clostridium sp.]
MKRILSLVFFALFLTSCSYSNTSGSGEKIIPPSYEDSPIYGTWKITKQLQKREYSPDNQVISNVLNQEIAITDKYIIINNYYWDNVSYKMKIVSTKDYFTTLGYTSSPNNQIPTADIKVFSATYNTVNSICDIALKDSKNAILSIAGNIYEVEKVSDSIDVEKSKLTDIKEAHPVKNYTANTKTGSLIGLKTNTTLNGESKTSYRTLWISKEGNHLNKIYQLSDIVFPRRNGFWSIREENIIKNNVKENIFVPRDLSSSSTPILDPESLVTEQSVHGYSSGEIKKEINFISNDLVSLSITGKAMRNGNEEPLSKLHVYPISSLPFENSISIEDIFKGTSVDFILNEFYTTLSTIKGDITFLNSDESNQNIGISRRDGHWMFKGRIPYIDNATKKFIPYDYNLSLIPPSNVVVYDNLFEPLTKIKESVPYAIDAFSSPDNSLCIVVSDSHLYIYDIVEGPLGNLRLSDNYLTKLELNDGESVVMSEWASGEYVDSWNKTLLLQDNIKEIKK